jgi:hypothetical protein
MYSNHCITILISNIVVKCVYVHLVRYDVQSSHIIRYTWLRITFHLMNVKETVAS